MDAAMELSPVSQTGQFRTLDRNPQCAKGKDSYYSELARS